MLKLGIFLPVANNGWIMSSTAPQFMPTWELNRDVSQLAEAVGFDYVFSMAKWRGLGGATHFWDYSVESFTLIAGLAAATNRLRLVASVSPALVHPAVIAKMAVTIDHISHGRLALNIVSAGNEAEYSQMSLYPENFESYRYEYTEEWLNVAKALWTEPSVTFNGQFFHLEDCRSDPKPLQQPHPPIVCATNSERGFEFVAEHCEEAFIGGTLEDLRKKTDTLKAMAADRGRTVGTQKHISVIQADTDADAQRIVELYREGADYEAIQQVYGRQRNGAAPSEEEMRKTYNSPRFIHYYTSA
ncbi:MAG TPA: LLM class flavin-dependent oxidoreductase, partial [Chloroflexota bacterium]